MHTQVYTYCCGSAAYSQLPPSEIVVHMIMCTECVWTLYSGPVCRRTVGDVAPTLEPSQPLLNSFSHRAKATRSAVGCEVTAVLLLTQYMLSLPSK